MNQTITVWPTPYLMENPQENVNRKKFCALGSYNCKHPRMHCFSIGMLLWSIQLCRLMTKPTKWSVRPAKIQISLGIRLVWSESSLCAQSVAEDPLFLHANSEDFDQRRLWSDWAAAQADGAHTILLVLSWSSSISFVLGYQRPDHKTAICIMEEKFQGWHYIRSPIMGLLNVKTSTNVMWKELLIVVTLSVKMV